jgi:phasin family protein
MATATLADASAKEAVKTAEKAKVAADQFTTAGAKAFREGVEKSLAGLNDLNAQSKQNLEALVASATATAKGAESLGAQALAYSKSAMENHVEAAKALSSARSVQEAIELQTAYAKSAIETYMAEMNKASETFSATVKGAFRPLNERATAVIETMQAAR